MTFLRACRDGAVSAGRPRRSRDRPRGFCKTHSQTEYGVEEWLLVEAQLPIRSHDGQEVARARLSRRQVRAEAIDVGTTRALPGDVDRDLLPLVHRRVSFVAIERGQRCVVKR